MDFRTPNDNVTTPLLKNLLVILVRKTKNAWEGLARSIGCLQTYQPLYSLMVGPCKLWLVCTYVYTRVCALVIILLLLPQSVLPLSCDHIGASFHVAKDLGLNNLKLSGPATHDSVFFINGFICKTDVHMFTLHLEWGVLKIFFFSTYFLTCAFVICCFI